MSNLNDELNNVPTEIQNDLNLGVQSDMASEVEAVESLGPEVNHNLSVATELSKQNPQRAREILMERLSRLSDEKIENLRAAKAAKIEAQQAKAVAVEAVSAEESATASTVEMELESEIPSVVPPVAVPAVPVVAPVVAPVTSSNKSRTKKHKKKGPRISYESKQAFSGFMFVLPWFIGFLLFFAYPCFQSLQFSFSRVAVFQQYQCTWIAFENYAEILTTEATFMQALTNTLSDLAINVPVVLIFSLFVAVLLNRKFPGRGLVRGIFFLPVIVTTGVVMSTFSSSDSNAAFSGDMNNGILFQMTDASEFLVDLGLNETITQYMMDVADRIFDVVWDSGVQILLFLAALQGISPQLYEASSVEGATAWETFWLITFPNVAPIILVNIVYTIVDTYNDPENSVLSQINTLMNVSFNLGGAAAASWTFFLVIFALLGIIFGVYALLTKKST